MSHDRDTLLLKSVAKDMIEHIWKTEFYNDAEDYILYRDPKTRETHRRDDEIDEINLELNRLKDDLIDEIVEDLITNKISSMEDIAKSYEKVREICHSRFGDYRRKLWNVVKP